MPALHREPTWSTAIILKHMAAPLFKFGLISDVQWADIPDGKSFHGTPRYYREALCSARRAVAAFKAEDVNLAIHLGDIVDYHNTHNGSSEMALQAAIECFDSLDRPVLHCIGNREFRKLTTGYYRQLHRHCGILAPLYTIMCS